MAVCSRTSLISSLVRPLFRAPLMCSFSSCSLPSATSMPRFSTERILRGSPGRFQMSFQQYVFSSSTNSSLNSSTCPIALSTYSAPSTARRVCKPFLARSSWLRLSMPESFRGISVVFDAGGRIVRRLARVGVDPFGDTDLGFGFGDRVGRLEGRVLAAFRVRSCFRQRGERPVLGRAVAGPPIDAVGALGELDPIVL